MDRQNQTAQDIIVAIPLMKRDGTQAVGLQTGQLSTKILKPDGTAATGYTEATFTEPNADGVYVVKFPTAAATKAFGVASLLNPYTLTLRSFQEGIQPMTVNVWITS